MRLAIIDMGTNTFNLLITETQAEKFEILYTTRHPVKLGQKSEENHYINKVGIIRILEVLEMYLKEVQKYKTDKIVAVATSSIRTAKNKTEVLQTIKKKLNIEVCVIDGDREAELIYYGTKYAITPCNDKMYSNCLIVDIGGGSTEFIITDEHTALWKKSFLLGMARIMDEIKPRDPIQTTDIQNIHNYLDKVLKPLQESVNKYKPKILVGASGVFDSVVEMIEANIGKVQKTESCCIITYSDFYTIYNKMLPLTYSERLNFKGLVEMRVDMIMVSLILIDYILKKYSLEKIIVSFYSLKEGLVIEEMKKQYL